MKKQNQTANYMRVSTASQKPDSQKDGLYAYAGRAGLIIVSEYLDIAVSGRKEGRPQSLCPQCRSLTTGPGRV